MLYFSNLTTTPLRACPPTSNNELLYGNKEQVLCLPSKLFLEQHNQCLVSFTNHAEVDTLEFDHLALNDSLIYTLHNQWFLLEYQTALLC